MKRLRVLTALLLAMFTLLPSFSALAVRRDTVYVPEPGSAIASLADEEQELRGKSKSIELDTSSSGGYRGDYVIIYNSSSDPTSSKKTGSLSGKIVTSVSGPNANCEPAKGAEGLFGEEGFTVDADCVLNDKYANVKMPEDSDGTKGTYTVGMTKKFHIYDYNPSGSEMVKFKLLYQGTYCNIWTVTNSKYYPLDKISSGYAKKAAKAFDSKYALMLNTFGSFKSGANGDGRVHLLFYNIDDKGSVGNGHLTGYFSSYDYVENKLAMVHIDTYPSIMYYDSNGNKHKDITECYSTMEHEFQHLINYCQTGGMANWLNEALSGAAEELCYPGDALFSRIQQWHNYNWKYTNELKSPPKEYKYTSSYDLHKGGALHKWKSGNKDILARYAEVLLFSQYLYSRWGSTKIYKKIIQNTKSNTVTGSYNALKKATGWTLDSIFKEFFVSMVANDLKSGYGFKMNDGYDPSDFYNVKDLYSLLAPVVYTSTKSATIKSGGFIVIKPKNGVFYPPSGASSGLKYVGVTLYSSRLSCPQLTGTNIESTGKSKISWNSVSGAVKYKVYRATSKSGSYSLVKTTTSKSYTDDDAKPGKTYYYKVKAIAKEEKNDSYFSKVLKLTCDLARPKVSITLSSGGKPKLSWKKVEGAVKYDVYRNTEQYGNYTFLKSTTSLSFTNSGAQSGTKYYYIVFARASNSDGDSAYSNIVSIRSK